MFRHDIAPHLLELIHGRGVRALGIGEDVQVGDGQFGQKRNGVLEPLVRFGRKSHDDVHADGGIWHGFLDARNAIRVEFAAISAAHLAEHEVIATLQWKVEVGHERPGPCNKFDDFGGEQVGFARRDAEALDAVYGIQGAQEVNQALASLLSEEADVDAGQDNLPVSRFGNVLGLSQNAIDGVRSTAPTRLGNRAEGTGVVTAVLYLQKGAGPLGGGKR